MKQNIYHTGNRSVKRSMKWLLCTILVTLHSTLFISCAGDFLDVENTTNLNKETFFDSEEALQAQTATLYNYVWHGFNGKFYYGMGDGRANNITAQYSDYIYPYTNFAEGSLSEGLSDAWNSFYSVVAQSNNAIENIEGASVGDNLKKQYIAEARFMRGLAYWYIGSLWSGGIIYTNTSALIESYNSVQPNPQLDIIEFAIRDMEYAAVYLPETAPFTGRITKYTAFAALSRIYLSMAGLVSGNEVYNGSNVATNFDRSYRNTYYLDLAKKAAKKAIDGSGCKLLDNYGDLFSNDLGKSNNNAESLFQLQWMQGSTDAIGWGCNQEIACFFGWSTMVSDGTNWGGATYCSWDLWKDFNKEKTTSGKPDKRRHWCVASIGEEYPDLGTDADGKPYTYGKTENPGTEGVNIRKYVVGINKVNGYSYKQSSGINTTMIRLAEVYLNYVEAAMGNNPSPAGPTALEYFNAIRKRAGLPSVASIDYEALRKEYRLELAFEGLYWYFLLRRAYYKQTDVLAYMNNQQRNASFGEKNDTYTLEETEGYCLNKEYAAPGTGVSLATPANLVLPIPDSDQGKNPNLKPIDAERHLNTVPYSFGEREVNINDILK